jgi:S-adenosylmethionine:tRNA ribosyltransferase-isomerase
MRVSDFHFDLPEDLIAQHPPVERGSSRMLVLDRLTGAVTDEAFRNLPELLRPGDLLILNDSRVLPARLFATRGGLATQAGSPRPSGVIEVLLTEEVGSSGEQGGGMVWKALVKPAKKMQVGERLYFAESMGATNAEIFRSAQNDNPSNSEATLTAEVVETGEFGERTLRFGEVGDFYERVSRIGHMPLPPYIHRDQRGQADSVEDRERYQTVYSQSVGSAAAPTAGLHFTPEILAELEARGVEVRYLTLHVGLGTFQPVRVDRLEDIRLHAERYTLQAETAEALNRALAEGRRVVAVGTTTTRTLEHIALRAEEVAPELKPNRSELFVRGAEEGAEKVEKHVAEAKAGVDLTEVNAGTEVPAYQIRPFSAASEAPHTLRFHAHSGATSIFIAPGHKFRVVSGLVTNFHLPESTLVMLVSAFAAPEGDPDAGRRMVLGAYEHAIRKRYRFYSYGDCMLVI